MSLAAAYVASAAVYAAIHVARSADLARASKRFSRNARAGGPRLLVVGDSTAKGTGASAPRNSVPGLIGRANPALTVVNRGEDGATFKRVLRQLDGESAHYDAVLVLAGANDVFFMTPLRTLRKRIFAAAEQARALSSLVILMPAGNVGNAPFFLPPWSWLMTRRARALHKFTAQAARATGARYVDLYRSHADDPFVQQAREMNAADGLHPSDAGYAFWVSELQSQARLSELLALRAA